jgi:hypothetical protein
MTKALKCPIMFTHAWLSVWEPLIGIEFSQGEKTGVQYFSKEKVSMVLNNEEQLKLFSLGRIEIERPVYAEEVFKMPVELRAFSSVVETKKTFHKLYEAP